MISLSVGAFLHKPQGTQEKIIIDSPMSFNEADGIALISNITADVRLLKLPHEINVQLHNVKTRAEVECSRCLTSFEYQISIPFTEREFLIELQDREILLQEDVFYVDKETNSIVLDEMLRQEILLHFPSAAVCSESCKGLCDRCGANLNQKPCTCDNSLTR